jgi:hypothetical protein
MSLFYGSNYRLQQQQLQQQQRLQQKESESRCTKKYLIKENYVNYIDFKQIKDDFDIGGIFDFSGIGSYLNDAEAKKKLYNTKCENRRLNTNAKKKCNQIKELRDKAYKVAYNILSTYLKKKTLKRIAKVAGKPYKVDRINKLACSLKALSDIHNNTNLCTSSSDRFIDTKSLIDKFTAKFKDSRNMYKLAEVFIDSIINNEKRTEIIEVLNKMKDDKNNKEFLTVLYNLIDKVQPCPT